MRHSRRSGCLRRRPPSPLPRVRSIPAIRATLTHRVIAGRLALGAVSAPWTASKSVLGALWCAQSVRKTCLEGPEKPALEPDFGAIGVGYQTRRHSQDARFAVPIEAGQPSRIYDARAGA